MEIIINHLLNQLGHNFESTFHAKVYDVGEATNPIFFLERMRIVSRQVDDVIDESFIGTRAVGSDCQYLEVERNEYIQPLKHLTVFSIRQTYFFVELVILDGLMEMICYVNTTKVALQISESYRYVHRRELVGQH